MLAIGRHWSQRAESFPGGAIVDSLPLLSRCISFGVVAGGIPYDFINGVHLSPAGNAWHSERYYGQYATVGSAAADGWTASIRSQNLSSFTTGSAFAAFYSTASNTTLKRVVRVANSTSGTILALALGDGTNNAIVGSAQVAPSGFLSCRTSLAPAANTPYTAAFTRSGTTMGMYVNGAAVAKTDVNQNGNAFLANVDRISVGTSGGSGPLSGGVLCWGVWARSLTSDDVAELHRIVTTSAWHALGLRARALVLPTFAAGILPTLSLSTYKPGTLTASGWTPRVTAS